MASKTDSISTTASKESRHLSRLATMGVSIGVSVALLAIALLWSIRRHRRNRANSTPPVYSAPSPIDRSTIRVIPNADIEATPNFTTNFQNEPIELEGAAVTPTDTSYRASPMREPGETSIYSNRVSAITTDNNRWSAVLLASQQTDSNSTSVKTMASP